MPLVQTRGAASAQGFGEFAQATAVNYIEDVFSTYLYTGTGASQTITNNIDLSTKGGLVWVKSRAGASGAEDHILVDTVRGTSSGLRTNTTGAAGGSAGFTSFDTTGFSFGSSFGVRNDASTTYASWTFREQPKFFDVVTYTGDGTGGQTVAHNLTSQPGFILIKRTDNISNWVSLARTGASYYALMYLNLDFQSYAPTISQSSAASSTNINVGFISTQAGVNTNGATYVAYLFAHNAGGFGLTGTDNVISCGSFTTDGSGDASVNLGYEPQWLMTKCATDPGFATNWSIYDTMRSWTGNAASAGNVQRNLIPNLSNAESINNTSRPTATGFEAQSTFASSTIIYIAIRRGPMKVPTDATKVFQAALRIGTGATATVTGINFPPDLSILGNRTIVNTRNFWDRLRGVGRYLGPYTVGAEVSNATTVTSFNMNGISLGADTSNSANYSGSDFVNYYFLRAPGFFDEVCYTGTGTARTVTHNLAAVPELIFVKTRSNAYSWATYTAATGNTKALKLESTAASQTVDWWNNTTPTSSVFSLYASLPFYPNYEVNGNGDTYVAYLFATCAGVSKVGSYTGNGTTQTINCGFTGGARFVLIKRTDATGDWYTYDTARGMTVLTDPYLLLNSAVAETATLGSVTTVSTGFALDSAILADINVSAGTYIFLAVA